MFRTVRMLGPSLATLALAGLLVFTIFFTEFDWQWIAFLSGVLFAAVLSLISASWKAQWGMEQSSEHVAQLREHLAVEVAAHRQTGERLEREQGLHHQDRERLARQIETLRATEARANVATDTLRMLERDLPVPVCIVDAELRCRFHTRAFAACAGRRAAQIDDRAIEEVLSGFDVAALLAALADARAGRAAQVNLSRSATESAPKSYTASLIPQRDAGGRVTGIIVALRDAADESSLPEVEPDAPGDVTTGFLVTDESGQAVYLHSLTAELTGWSDSLSRIREAIDQDGFDLHGQDIVALGAGVNPERMLEVLIRMRDEEEHHLPPGAFFPAAEHYGLMPEIDRWVVNKTVGACAAVDASARGELAPRCINVARATLQDRTFTEFVGGALGRHDVRADLLCFEIADSDAIALIDEAARFATDVKRLGCRVSLDGFGSAGVGFDHVKSLPLDFLKIDGRIILAITRDPVAVAKVNAIGRVCRGIGVRTIAEMVESDDVQRKLQSLHVDYVQGFGIAKPHPL